MYVFFPFILDVRFVGRTSRGHTGFLIRLPSAVHALIFLARRIQSFLSLVDREVGFCVLLAIQSFSTCSAFYLFIYWSIFFSEEEFRYRDSNSCPNTCQKVSRLPTELPGRPAPEYMLRYTLWVSIYYMIL